MSDLPRGALPLLLLAAFWPVIFLAILDARQAPPPTEQHRECVNPINTYLENTHELQ